MDDVGFWHKAATATTGVLLAVLSFVWKEHSSKVKHLEGQINTFPLLFISKEDCEKIHDRRRDTSFALAEKVDAGFNRVFAKMDLIQNEMVDRHEKLRDLIDTRTLK